MATLMANLLMNSVRLAPRFLLTLVVAYSNVQYFVNNTIRTSVDFILTHLQSTRDVELITSFLPIAHETSCVVPSYKKCASRSTRAYARTNNQPCNSGAPAKSPEFLTCDNNVRHSSVLAW